MSRWRAPTFHDDVWIVRPRGAGPETGASALEPDVAAFLVAAWFGDDLGARAVLFEICADLGLGSVGPRVSTEELRERIREALRRRRLVARLTPRAVASSPRTAEHEPPAPERAPIPAEKTWIAIVLHDDAAMPVPHARYAIDLPDGSIREGRLDAGGRARIDGIDPGSCSVSFPDYDGGDWAAA
jgi:hypothetical protein